MSVVSNILGPKIDIDSFSVLYTFSGDNIFGSDVKDAVKSMDAAFAPAIASKIPWVAVLGNHDQESTLSRQELMNYIVKLPNTLSQVNPPEAAHYIDGFGNYNLEIHGVAESSLQDKSLLNLYFLDSGDYSSVQSLKGYDWIKTSQQFWYDQTSKRLQVPSSTNNQSCFPLISNTIKKHLASEVGRELK